MTGGSFDNNIECMYILNEQMEQYIISVIPSKIVKNACPPFDNTSWQD